MDECQGPYSGITLDFFAPDGHGGFWLDSSSSPSKTSVLHYSATGQWSRTLTSGSMGPIALVPGARFAVGRAGSAPATTPASTTRIWEYGQAG